MTLEISATLPWILKSIFLCAHSACCCVKSMVNVFVCESFHSILVRACTCVGLRHPWISLLWAQVFPHHLLKWTHEHRDEAVDVAGVVTAGWLQDHQCSWKTNEWRKIKMGNTIILTRTSTSGGGKVTDTYTCSQLVFIRRQGLDFFLNLTKVPVCQRGTGRDRYE